MVVGATVVVLANVGPTLVIGACATRAGELVRGEEREVELELETSPPLAAPLWPLPVMWLLRPLLFPFMLLNCAAVCIRLISLEQAAL